MEFEKFKELQQAFFAKMTQDVFHLFVVDIDKDILWNTYLNAFPEGTNEVFRERREYDCSGCGNFVKNFGGVVAIVDNKIQTIWDFESDEDKFSVVTSVMSDLVRSAPVRDVFVSKQVSYGINQNREQLENGTVISWEHLFVRLPKKLKSTSSESEASLMGQYRDSRNVFKRSLTEISRDAVMTVLDMVDEKTLYKGEEWVGALTQFLSLQDKFSALSGEDQENFCWKVSTTLSGGVSRIRNHSIGVLLQDITEGVDLNTAVKRYENIVAPHNYKRPKAIFSRKMVEQAEQTITELGLLESLGRRHAKLSDISINNVLWADRDAEKVMGGIGGVFEAMKQEVSVTPNSFKNVKGIGIDQFMENVLPSAKKVEVLMENGHISNLVSLIAPINSESKSMFKWSNPFGWAYSGNITDSSMKQNVQAAGGKVDGVLRFSLQWNDREYNRNDYDAHCVEPNGNHIYFSNAGRRHSSTGVLDVDIVSPRQGIPAVENIAWERLLDGDYHFYVKNYSHNGGTDGFDAEIEYNGQVFHYEYHNDLRHKSNVTIAKIRFTNGSMEILESLPSTTSSREVWGLKTNQFQTVSSVMYSPNYWDGQDGIGNKHYMFMIAGCENDTRPYGFFNEYLCEDLNKHRKVFEALGGRMKVERSEDQLSGLGFSSTKRNALIVKVGNKVFKVIF